MCSGTRTHTDCLLLCVQFKLLSFQQNNERTYSWECSASMTNNVTVVKLTHVLLALPPSPPCVSALLCIWRCPGHTHIDIHIHTHGTANMHRVNAFPGTCIGTVTCTVKWQISKRKVRAPVTVTLYIGVPFRSTHAVLVWMDALLPPFLSYSHSYNNCLTRRLPPAPCPSRRPISHSLSSIYLVSHRHPYNSLVSQRSAIRSSKIL